MDDDTRSQTSTKRGFVPTKKTLASALGKVQTEG